MVEGTKSDAVDGSQTHDIDYAQFIIVMSYLLLIFIIVCLGWKLEISCYYVEEQKRRLNCFQEEEYFCELLTSGEVFVGGGRL